MKYGTEHDSFAACCWLEKKKIKTNAIFTCENKHDKHKKLL